MRAQIKQTVSTLTGEIRMTPESKAIAEWVVAILNDGNPHPARDIRRAAEERGYRWFTVQRTFRRLGGRSKQLPNEGNGSAGWEWRLLIF